MNSIDKAKETGVTGHGNALAPVPDSRSELPSAVDIATNRRANKWSNRELLGRAFWEVLRTPLFRITPRPMWAWRRWILRMFGAKIGRDVHVFPTVRIAIPWNLRIDDEASVGDYAILYSLGVISIGRRATISQHAHLCAGTHDYLRNDLLLLKPPISIGADAWICADAFVGPGVSVGPAAVVGARAVAIKNIAANIVVAGNPAKVVRQRPTLQQG